MNGKNLTNHMKKGRKTVLLLTSLVLLLMIGIVGTAAFLIDDSGTVENTFRAGEFPPDIVEEFDGTVKENVRIRNGGNVNAYIRTAIVVNWVDETGNVYGTAPKQEEYTLEMNLATPGRASRWIQGADGNYYWSKEVPPKQETDRLIVACRLNDGVNIPNGYHFSVEILAQSVQASPDEAVEEAWSNSRVLIEADTGTLNVINRTAN